MANAPGFALRRQVFRKLARWQIGPESSIHRGTRLFCLGGLQIGRAKDVAPYTIVAGSPAKVVGQRSQDLQYELTHQPWFF